MLLRTMKIIASFCILNIALWHHVMGNDQASCPSFYSNTHPASVWNDIESFGDRFIESARIVKP